MQADLRRVQDQLGVRVDDLKQALAALDAFKAGSVKSEQVWSPCVCASD